MKRKNLYRKAVCVLPFLHLVLSGCGGTGRREYRKQDRLQTHRKLCLLSVWKTRGRRPGFGVHVTQSRKFPAWQVVTTFFPVMILPGRSGGLGGRDFMLLKPGEEVHSYEPTPRDIKTIQNSDLFIYVGGENDVWVDNILDSVRKTERSLPRVRLTGSDRNLRRRELSRGMMEDHDHKATSTKPARRRP